MRIRFDSKDLRHKTPFGTIDAGEECRITIHIPKPCGARDVSLVFENENGSEYSRFVMEYTGSEGDYEFFSSRFTIRDAGLYFYYFRIVTDNDDFRLFREGYDLTNMEEGDKWQLTCLPAGYRTPGELGGRVMYQIFPDRFCRGREADLTGKLEPYRIHADMRDIPEYAPDPDGIVRNCDFFGGNLDGITSKLDYLAGLGVGVIYLNPIFRAWSNHRYDTADYMRIDEMLGTEDDFRRLCSEAHARNIRIILDGVFSHTGSRSIYFDELGEFGGGAYRDPMSPYVKWFDFRHYPDDYASWWGVSTLPCVNEMDPDYIRFIISGEDSVVAHWMRAGADGFRLDVADELPDDFILLLRNRIKEIDPDALLIGEVWEDASNKCSYGVRRKYFSGGELDSVMNYPFRTAIMDFVTGNDAGYGLRNTVMTVAENYPGRVLNLLMNMLSTHDTPRILSLLAPHQPAPGKSERAGYRMTDSGDISEAFRRFRAASFIQFMLPGMPCIYYGDEIGTEGFEDPLCRTFFDWDRADAGNGTLSFFRALGRLRNTEKALKHGNINITTDGCGTVIINREADGESLTAAVCCGSGYEGKLTGEPVMFQRCTCLEGTGGKYALDRNGFILIKNN